MLLNAAVDKNQAHGQPPKVAYIVAFSSSPATCYSLGRSTGRYEYAEEL